MLGVQICDLRTLQTESCLDGVPAGHSQWLHKRAGRHNKDRARELCSCWELLNIIDVRKKRTHSLSRPC